MTLVVAGLYTLLLFIRSLFRKKTTMPAKRQMLYVAAGIVLLLLGIVFYLAPSNRDDSLTTSSPTILGVTIRRSSENGELVIVQKINFFDEDGNINLIERQMVDLSDPSQRANIDLKNIVVDTPPELQKIRSTVTDTWHCAGHTYLATVEVSLVDQDGNKSEPVRYRIDCN